ncbi:MAG: phosphotransferase [Phycisphaerales bacterium]|nr:phosphotransferase [Phycisphaerales bacterium]
MNPIHSTIRNVKRFHAIVTTLAGFGFASFLQDTGIERLLDRGAELLGRPSRETQHLSAAHRMRLAMEELGPTFIKAGQILSTRRDLVPEEWTKEFSKLQDKVPPQPFEEIQERLREELGGALTEIVAEVDPTPMAAASMAQVHRARLKDGREVVLKVLRPGIEETVEADLEILRFLANRVEARFRNLGVKPVELVNEFAREINKELDLEHEGRATDRLRRSFEEDPGVVFPEVFWELSSHRVLALEEIHGLPVSRIKPGDISPEDAKRAVQSGANAVLRQCLEIGFFHADPHPGNLFVLPGGRIAFIDCGMTGTIDPAGRLQLARVVHGAATGNVDEVMSAAIALADVDPETIDQRLLRRDIQDIVEQFHNVPLERFNLTAVLDQFFATLRRHHVTVPGDLVMLIKSLGSIEGVGRTLDPEFDMISCARPFIERLILEHSSPLAIARRMKDATAAYAHLLESLPEELSDLFSRLRRNRLTMNLELRGLARVTTAIEHASRNIAYALVIAALVVGSSILILSDKGSDRWLWTTVGTVGFILAGLIGSVMLAANRAYSRRNEPKP